MDLRFGLLTDRSENRTYQGDDVRRRLMDAAEELVALRPVEDLTVTDFTDEAEIKRTSFYRHFTNSTELVGNMIIDRVHRMYVDAVPEVGEEISAFLPRGIEVVYTQWKVRKWVFIAGMSLACGNRQFGDYWHHEILDRWGDNIHKTYLNSVESGSVAPVDQPRLVAQLNLGTILWGFYDFFRRAEEHAEGQDELHKNMIIKNSLAAYGIDWNLPSQP